MANSSAEGQGKRLRARIQKLDLELSMWKTLSRNNSDEPLMDTDEH
jgi:hypothetical protein